METYFIANNCNEAQYRSDSQDDQSNFPAVAEADDEGAEECGVSLNN